MEIARHQREKLEQLCRNVSRRPFAVQRLKRVFGIEIEDSARRGGKLRIIASIEAPEQHRPELPIGVRAQPVRAGIAGAVGGSAGRVRHKACYAHKPGLQSRLNLLSGSAWSIDSFDTTALMEPSETAADVTLCGSH